LRKEVGIDRVLAEVLPGDKVAEVKRLQGIGQAHKSSQQVVAMVGDGINDAPALAQADVGIAIGTGTDVAMAAAGITLISGDLRGVARAISLSRGTLQTIVQNLFWAFFNVFLIPLAALGFLIPMVAAGAMAFSSIFVVTNSLRLRGYDIQKLAAPKSLARQLGELAPRLVVPAGTLAVLVAVSVGWLQPVSRDAMTGGGSGRRTTTYRAFIDQKTPLVAGQLNQLNIAILDQFGRPFTDFDPNPYGQTVQIRVASRDLAFLAADSIEEGASGSGGMMGGGRGAAPSASTTQKASSATRNIQSKFVFPADGQYVAFVDFWPRTGDEVVLAVPLTVGAARTEPVAITAADSLTRTVGDLQVSLKSGEPFRAGQYNYMDFEVIDAQGQVRSEEIQLLSGNLCQLELIDDKLTTFLRPAFLNRHILRFSAYFPKPGKYRAWFSFYYADTADLSFPRATAQRFRDWYLRSHPDQLYRLAFDIDVK
jgi:haloacid dehalogenase-like hydrolase